MPDQYLRPEANPVTYENLYPGQKTAYRRLAAMLAEAVDELPDRREKPPRDPGTFRLDFRRKTRVALLSGGRGTGKTSALLSLINDINKRTIPNETAGVAPDPDTPSSGRPPVKGLKETLPKLPGRLVWLDVLDMSPLPALANLFSAILVRIEEAATRGLPGEPVSRAARSLLAPPEVRDSPIEKLKRLQTDVAVSWEGNLKQRAGHMDANAFAAEVRRAEHVRLKLNERLVEVLDGLAEQSFTSGPHSDDQAELFVLPVDDFDLNPPRCLELLELLRTLSVPRLFFVVLGDVAVAELMCGLQIAGDMARVAGGAWGGEFLPAHPHEIQSLTANVSGNILRKLLPPGQRVHLGPAKLAEALKFRPVGSQTATPILGKCLEGFILPLDRWPREVQRRFRTTDKVEPPVTLNLSQFLFAQNWTATLGATGGQFYHARRFLELPLRHLADLWFALSKASEPDPAGMRTPFDRLRAELHYFCRDIFQSEVSLPPEARRKFLAEFNVDPDTGWTISPDPFRLVPAMYRYVAESGNMAPTRTESLAPAITGIRIRCRSSTGWEFREKEQQLNSRPLFLSPSTTDLILFYTDLATLARGDGERNPLLDIANVGWRFASVKYEFVRSVPVRSYPTVASSELNVSGNVFITGVGSEGGHPQSVLYTFPEFAWPFPPVATFWEADRFLDGWLQVIKGVEKERMSTESAAGPIPHLVYQWINLGHAVLSGDWPLVRGYPSSFTESDWNQLAERMEQLRAKSAVATNGDRVIRWIVEVLSLLNEEFLGPNPDMVKVFVKQTNLLKLCQDRGRRFALTKEEYLRQIKTPEDVLTDFFERYREFPVWWAPPPPPPPPPPPSVDVKASASPPPPSTPAT